MSNSEYGSELLRTLSQKLGRSPEEIASSAKAGDINGLLGKMDQKQKDKVNSILSDPEAVKKIMDNPQVQAIIRKLGHNG